VRDGDSALCQITLTSCFYQRMDRAGFRQRLSSQYPTCTLHCKAVWVFQNKGNFLWSLIPVELCRLFSCCVTSSTVSSTYSSAVVSWWHSAFAFIPSTKAEALVKSISIILCSTSARINVSTVKKDRFRLDTNGQNPSIKSVTGRPLISRRKQRWIECFSDVEGAKDIIMSSWD